MKNFKRIFTVIFSCVLIICTLALVAACKAEEKEEGYFVGTRFVGKDDKVVGRWDCSVPDSLAGYDYDGGFFYSPEKPEGYKSAYKVMYIIDIIYTAPDANGGHVAGYSMTIKQMWWNLESRARHSSEGHGLLQVGQKDIKLEENQYYYRGGFYMTYEGEGYIFTLDKKDSGEYILSAVNVEDSSKVLTFIKTAITLEQYEEYHSSIRLPERN
ncbi:MAG: hypothetical protein K2M17_01995 [Bacilli bacterium]|nr:hypothetical protein [Bacilli bacterium]